MSETETKDWIYASRGRRLLGITEHAMDQLIANGVLAVRQIPGSLRQVRRSEVEALARESTIEARRDREPQPAA